MNQNSLNNVGDWFDYIFSNFASRIALNFEEEEVKITYKELKKKVDQVICKFLDLDCKKGDICVIFNDKSMLGFASIIACIYLGIIFVNLDNESPKDRLEKIFQKCKPKFLINFSCQKETISKLKIKFKTICIENFNFDFKNQNSFAKYKKPETLDPEVSHSEAILYHSLPPGRQIHQLSIKTE